MSCEAVFICMLINGKLAHLQLELSPDLLGVEALDVQLPGTGRRRGERPGVVEQGLGRGPGRRGHARRGPQEHALVGDRSLEGPDGRAQVALECICRFSAVRAVTYDTVARPVVHYVA